MSSPPEDPQSLFVPQELAGLRLDKFLFEFYKQELSRTYFQKLIQDGLVLVNGKAVKKQYKVEEGDEVEVEFALREEITLKPEAIPLEILYEDQDLLVANKPPGMVVHPAPGNWSGTFVNALLHHCGTDFLHDATLRPGIVHRLDKDTSGCLIGAKNLSAQQKLIELFSGRKVHKEYLAICLGNPGNGTIDKPIGRHPTKRKLMAISEEKGRRAITHYKTLAHSSTLSLVHVILETGRTHQIRVHLQDRCTPLLGDEIYGNSSSNKKFQAERQLLHAYKLTFPHPITGENIAVTAPIPKDLQLFIDKVTGPSWSGLL